MSFRVTVLPQARGDVLRNAQWWAEHHSAEQAAHWLDTVETQLESLRNFPESHSLSIENNEFSYEIREKLVGLGSRPRYRAVFTIKGDQVFVLTVRAAEQDRLTSKEVAFDSYLHQTASFLNRNPDDSRVGCSPRGARRIAEKLAEAFLYASGSEGSMWRRVARCFRPPHPVPLSP